MVVFAVLLVVLKPLVFDPVLGLFEEAGSCAPTEPKPLHVRCREKGRRAAPNLRA